MFIFFMTYEDKTVDNAFEVFEEVKDTGLKNIGFKDVGLPMSALKKLKAKIDGTGMNSFLEVVSEDKESSIRSAKSALELDVDYLIGGYGQYAQEIYDIIKGSGIKFYPYIGKVSGIPGRLRGEISDIVEEGKGKEEMGVDGIDLLAYRFDKDPVKLMKEVISALDIPVIVAGSINSRERIKEVVNAGATMFTIGTAIFDKKFVSSDSLTDQIEAVLEYVEEVS